MYPVQMLFRELLAVYTTTYCVHSFTDLVFQVTPQCSQPTLAAIPKPTKMLCPEEGSKQLSSSKQQEYIEAGELYVTTNVYIDRCYAVQFFCHTCFHSLGFINNSLFYGSIVGNLL
jgi:hypothetical protein